MELLEEAHLRIVLERTANLDRSRSSPWIDQAALRKPQEIGLE